MSIAQFFMTLHRSGNNTAAPDTTKHVFWVVGDSIANGTNNRTNEATPDPQGALYEWNGSSFAPVSDTATANDGSQYPAFAIAYKQATGKDVYVVESALGGAEFYPNGDTSNWYTSGTLYSAGKSSLDAALATENAVLKGVILICGINDARGSQTMANIQTGIASFLGRINTDFNTPPVYMFQIGREETGYTTRVREVQQLLYTAASGYSNVQVAGHLEGFSTLGYYGPDNLHLTQAGNNFLGGELAEAIHSTTYTNKTIPFRVKEQYTLNRYLFTGTYAQNPVTGNILHVFHNGAQHVFDSGKKVSGRRSTDNGLTHSTVFDVADPIEGGVQDCGGGYDSNGRYHLFYDVHQSFNAGVQHWMMYRYSDDDGVSWSAPVTLTRPSDGHNSFRVLGKVIENNGVLLKPYYSFTDEGSFGNSSRYLLRSTDYGQSWQHIQVENGANWITEGSVLASGNDVLYAMRIEDVTGTADDTVRFRFYKSADNGLTWNVQGTTGFGETHGYAHPAHLEKFKMNGVDIAACYYTNRATKQYKVIYGKLSDVMAGLSGWNTATKLTILDHDTYTAGGNPTMISGYGGVLHINNTLEAKGISFVDYGQTVPTYILYFDLPTTHYSTLKTQLGI